MPNGDNLRREAEEALEDARRLRTELTEGLVNDLAAIEATARDDREHRQIADDLERARNRVLELLDRISQLLTRIQYRPEPFEIARGAGTGFRLTTLASELQAELEWLKAIIEQLDAMLKPAGSCCIGMVREQSGPAGSGRTHENSIDPDASAEEVSREDLEHHLASPDAEGVEAEGQGREYGFRARAG